MTSPVSIGDAYLMGKLALKLGRAFTKGRKSAPAEFREVENQLYSLSAALSALEKSRAIDGSAISIDPARLPQVSQERQADGKDIVRSMLENCEETLKHLEKTVEKYSRLGKPKDTEAPLLKRWSREVVDNWKKIAWTTEGGDLATLRSQLTVHTNSLNLVLGVINNSQTDRVEDQVSQVAGMLKEIHGWFVENLKDGQRPSQPATEGTVVPSAQSPLLGLEFELYSESANDMQLPSGERPAAQQPMFLCHCLRQNGDVGSHQEVIGTFALSPLSFAMRLTGKERSWMLYKAADRTSNRLVSLVIKGISSSRNAEFEEHFVETLGISRSRTLLRRDMSTILAYIAPSQTGGAPEARILDLMGNMNAAQRVVERIMFTVNGQSYSRSSIDSIHVLHYKTLEEDRLLGDSSGVQLNLSLSDTAEIAVFYRQQSSEADDKDIDRTILRMRHNTRVKYQAGDVSVLLQSIDCTGLGKDEEIKGLSSMNVGIYFSTAEAAFHFKNKIEEMRMELFIMSLQKPQPHEKLILKLQARGVHTEEVDIEESEISIVQNSRTQRLRLIVTSKDGTTVISQDLREDFLKAPEGRPNFRSPTYVVQIEGKGTRKVFKYENGFKFFDFSDVQTDRLFELGLAAISTGSPSSVRRQLTDA